MFVVSCLLMQRCSSTSTDECFLLDYDVNDMPYGGALADAQILPLNTMVDGIVNGLNGVVGEQANTDGGDKYIGGGSNNGSKTKSLAILNSSLNSDPADSVIFRCHPLVALIIIFLRLALCL